MTTIRRIVTSKIDGNSANTTNDSEIRPFGETAFYVDDSGPTNKLVLAIHDGVKTHLRSKVVGPGVLYGSNADAGDDSGADTIKLIPDATLFDQGSNQYIVVDPTGGEPGHIHLRAGGTQDASTADLYLGGELTCVRVSDTSGNVTIRTTNVGDPNITMDWSFQQDGNLYFPGIGNNRIGESEPGVVVSSDASVVLQSNNTGESKELIFGTNGDLSLPNGITVMGGAPSLIVDTGNNLGIGTSRLQSASANCAIAVSDEFVADIEFNDDITVVQVGWTVVVGGTTYTVTAIDPAPPANQYRITAAGATFVQSTTYTFTNPTPIPSAWVFGNDGSLTTPGSGVISHLDNDLKLEVSGTDVIVLRTDGGDTVINADGSMTLPGGSSITDTGVMILGSGDTIGEGQRAARIGINGAVEGIAIGAGPHDWLFTNDGTLTFPGGMTIATESGGDTRLIVDGGNNYVEIKSNSAIFVGSTSNSNVQIGNPEGGTLTEILSERVKFLSQAVPAHSTGAPGDEPGLVAFDNNYMYYCTGLYGQTGHQIVVAADYLGRTTLNTNAFQLTKTADTLQITVGDIISDSNGGATSTVVTVTSDENYVYVGTGAQAFDCVFPLTFTSTDYIPGANIWKRVAWSADTW